MLCCGVGPAPAATFFIQPPPVRKGEGFFCGQTAVAVVVERKVSGAGPVSGTRRRSSGKRTYGEEEIAENNVNFAD